MAEHEPVVGSWWRYSEARQYRFRYVGRAQDGAYRFTRYSDDNPDEAVTIEVYNLGAMKPTDG